MKCDLSIEEAQQLILENICHLPTEMVSIVRAAGRVLAQVIKASHDLPGAAQSAVDGFALGDAAANVNSCFSLASISSPGAFNRIEISSRQAARVCTGDDLPAGTLSVVMHEKAEVRQEGIIRIMENVSPGSNIKQAGEDYKQGELLASVNTALTAGHVGLLAAFGHSELLVYQQPRVAMFSLSNNVVSCNQIPKPGQIRDSNVPIMTALINQVGGSTAGYVMASETDPQELIKYLDNFASTADVIVLTGGTYAQSRSEAQTLLERAGAKIIYWGTDIQPGSHNGFALYQSKPVFALSGNPAACTVGFNLFVMPALRYMQGLSPLPIQVRARCTNSYNKAARSHRLVRGRASYSKDGWEVTVLPGQKPSMLKSLVDSNALISMPAGHPQLEMGSEVTIILLSADEGKYI
jgi:molybdopterin molybdotransferase